MAGYFVFRADKTTIKAMSVDTLLHKWLRIPYKLHVGLDTGPRNAKVTVIFIHGLGSSNQMWRQTIHRSGTLPARVLAVDLLGFGSSPKPNWQTYSAIVHANALRSILRRHGVRGRVIIVGHSLGSLVAVQYAARYPGVHSLILCSPPLYRAPQEQKDGRITVPQLDDLYRRFYKYARSRQDLASKIALIVKQARLVDPNFTITEETLPAIASSLEMSIENQTTLHDVKSLKIPIDIVYGKLDPFVIARNLKTLERTHQNIKVTSVVAGHDIIGSKVFTTKVASLIKQHLEHIT